MYCMRHIDINSPAHFLPSFLSLSLSTVNLQQCLIFFSSLLFLAPYPHLNHPSSLQQSCDFVNGSPADSFLANYLFICTEVEAFCPSSFQGPAGMLRQQVHQQPSSSSSSSFSSSSVHRFQAQINLLF